MVSKFLPDGHSDRSKYSRSDKLLSFCQDRNSKDYTFFILPLSVLEVGKVISKMDDKKSTGWDGISVKLLKIELLYIVQTLVYITCAYKIMFFQPYSRERQIFHHPNQRPRMTVVLSQSCPFSQSHLKKTFINTWLTVWKHTIFSIPFSQASNVDILVRLRLSV